MAGPRAVLSRLCCFFGQHSWEGCACRVCGKEHHDWRWKVEPGDVYDAVSNFMDEMHYYYQECSRCGKVKRGK
ncbi:MAG: hypothetical protein JXR84_19455 [Anaerolineae bacterium]|nr:hypothetical protein [Anaerolineae bacterium]